MRIRIVYYSWQGHTRTVATALAELLGAELQRIEAVSESGMFGKAMRAMLGMRAAIRPLDASLGDVDHLIVATPVWAQKVPPYVNEYLAGLVNCSGKPFSVLVEMKGSGAESAIRAVRDRLTKKGMRFVSSAVTLEDEVDAGTYGRKIEEFAKAILQ
ncbi:hypothetical protein ABH15_05260 [Methanoculleus taiwanensis]|uniref:Flavodoxin-like domain-containing protein n=1 Tax=Methanoculleus taiwanensis TaxID=1550565 RepID=A0A498H2M2_9EURY|nr:hypothetical protein ABH15_05260 [Methanoculleus taiwanensis]